MQLTQIFVRKIPQVCLLTGILMPHGSKQYSLVGYWSHLRNDLGKYYSK